MSRAIIIPKGNTRTFNITVTGANVDGYNVQFMVKHQISDSDDKAVLFKEATIAGSSATISLSVDDTSIEEKTYLYDVKVLDDDNYAVSSEIGQFIIRGVVNE